MKEHAICFCLNKIKMSGKFAIPENLKVLLDDRITVEVISESNLNNLGIVIQQRSLTIKCDEKNVNLTGNLYLNHNIIEKNDGTWIILNEYFYGDKGYSSDDSKSTLVNLKTGEVVALTFILNFTDISLDKNYLLSDSDDGYETRTCRVYDISNINLINLIYVEEIDSENTVEITYYFDCHSRFATIYKYEFFSYNDFTTNNYSAMSEYINQKVHDGKRNDEITEGEMWRLGVKVFPSRATVVRVIDHEKVTPFVKGKGIKKYDYPGFAEKVEEKKKQGLEWHIAHNQTGMEYVPLVREFMKQFETPYGTYSKLNEMKEVVTLCTDNFSELEEYITC